MDRDDPTRRPITTHFEDESLDTPGKEHPAEEDWHETPSEEPIDDFADPEQAYAEEHIEADQGSELPSYAEDNDGPIEEEFAHGDDEHTFVDSKPSSARANAEQYLPKGMSAKPASPMMKYLPYGVAGIVLIVLGFLGFQQVQGMMAANDDAAAQQQAAKKEKTSPGDEPAAANNTPSAAQPDSMSQPQAQAQPLQGQPLQGQPQAQPGASTRGPDFILQPDGTQKPLPPGGLPPSATGGQPQMQPQAASPELQQQMAANAALQNQVAGMTQQLDALKASQAQLQDQLQKAQSAPPAPSADVTAMQNKIADLEQRLNAASSKPASAPSHRKTSMINKPSNRDDQDMPPPAVEEKTYAAHARSARHGHGRSRAGSDTEASRLQRDMNMRYGIGPGPGGMMGQNGSGPNGMGMNGGGSPLPGGGYGGPQDNAPPVMAVNAAGGGWILRSAQPGSAWLSQGMSSDLTRVVPGDKVPGLGTIVSVRMAAGRWLVEGTQGSVR